MVSVLMTMVKKMSLLVIMVRMVVVMSGLNFFDIFFCQHCNWPIRTLFAALVHSHSALLQRGVRVVALRMIAKEGRITAAHSPLISVQLQGVFLEIYL